MANANIVAKLLLDDKDYNAKLEKAKKTTSSFESSMKVVGTAVKAVTAAFGLTVTAAAAFGEALKANEGLGDSFRGAMASAKAGVDEFFISLTTGSFDGFIGRMKETIKTARELYDAMDDMETFKLYNQGNMAKYNAERERQMVIVRNANAVGEDGKRVYSDDQVRAAEDALKQLDQAIKDEMGRMQEKTGTAMSKWLSNVAAKTKASMDDVEAMLNDYGSRADIDERMKELEKYRTQTTVTSQSMAGVSTTTYAGARTTTYVQWMSDDAKKEYEALKRLKQYTDEELAEYQKLKENYYGIDQQLAQMESNSMRAMSRANRAVAGGGGSKQNTGKANRAVAGGGGSKQNTGKAIVFNVEYASQKTARVFQTLDEAVQEDIKALPESVTDTRMSSFATPTIDVNAAQASLTENGMQLIKEDQINTVNEYADALQGLSSVVSGMSGLVDESSSSWLSWAASALSSIAAVIPNLYTLAAAFGAETTAAAGSAVAKSAAGAAAGGPVATIAAALAVAGTIISTIASIPKYATGGVIPGTSFEGDNMLARVNSGEMVLNREQQNILDRRLSGMEGVVKFVIDGRNLVGVLNNQNSKTALAR